MSPDSRLPPLLSGQLPPPPRAAPVACRSSSRRCHHSHRLPPPSTTPDQRQAKHRTPSEVVRIVPPASASQINAAYPGARINNLQVAPVLATAPRRHPPPSATSARPARPDRPRACLHRQRQYRRCLFSRDVIIAYQRAGRRWSSVLGEP